MVGVKWPDRHCRDRKGTVAYARCIGQSLHLTGDEDQWRQDQCAQHWRTDRGPSSIAPTALVTRVVKDLVNLQ